uniref:Putative homing endonuclease n=1 Tax=viral metagenome TaxID=1070528 RepID=A0A6M3ITU3_9ZZZZ
MNMGEMLKTQNKKWTKETHQQYCRNYYWKNKKKRQEYNRQWKEKNPNWMKEWYQKNRENRMNKHQEWNLNNKIKQRKYRRDRRLIWKQFCIELGLVSCSICGYTRCWRALDFHHMNPDKKETRITTLMSLSLSEKNKEKFLKELKNMILICANCHRELHSEEEDKKDVPT